MALYTPLKNAAVFGYAALKGGSEAPSTEWGFGVVDFPTKFKLHVIYHFQNLGETKNTSRSGTIVISLYVCKKISISGGICIKQMLIPFAILKSNTRTS